MALPSQLLVKNIQLEDGKMVPAAHFFGRAESSALELTEEELGTAEAVRVRSRRAAVVGACVHWVCVLLGAGRVITNIHLLLVQSNTSNLQCDSPWCSRNWVCLPWCSLLGKLCGGLLHW